MHRARRVRYRRRGALLWGGRVFLLPSGGDPATGRRAFMTIQTLGIDIPKNVFQLHGVNRNGRVLLKRRVMPDRLLAVLAQIGPCTVVIEACTGAFYWARKFEAVGHQVKIISPQYVKPFVRRQKNDG